MNFREAAASFFCEMNLSIGIVVVNILLYNNNVFYTRSLKEDKYI